METIPSSCWIVGCMAARLKAWHRRSLLVYHRESAKKEQWLNLLMMGFGCRIRKEVDCHGMGSENS
ncbi:hypothetical protein PR202_ga24582 [Eleusine coracana subsp. coracana]|uniref:Uncharacterized protein n=1 Tax=Eleusine coracana subsp. coracana TaxID=191504 RepID=A0AAV5D9A0_ELECO|nr:hypothetical protein PR202_ga24582 [Eleusine coracana subsp. coracana]